MYESVCRWVLIQKPRQMRMSHENESYINNVVYVVPQNIMETDIKLRTILRRASLKLDRVS